MEGCLLRDSPSFDSRDSTGFCGYPLRPVHSANPFNRLFRLRGADRAHIFACAAIDAGTLVDDVLGIAGRYAADRAFRFTGTAVDAVVVD
jgi:hypothetical protein